MRLISVRPHRTQPGAVEPRVWWPVPPTLPLWSRSLLSLALTPGSQGLVWAEPGCLEQAQQPSMLSVS